MAEYDELVKRLRAAKAVVFKTEDVTLLGEAADAIEELSADCDMYRKGMTDEHNRAAKLAWDKEHCWIPVTERLPEDDTDVLCWYEYYHWSAEKVLPEYGIGHCWNGRWGGEVSNGCECKVLAWMPLPQPPKEET